MKRERFLVNKVESQICSVKQSLIGLHKEVLSLSHSGDDYQGIVKSNHCQRFFSSVLDGVLNLFSSFSKLEEFGRLHGVIQSNVGCDAPGSVICARTRIAQSSYLIR